MNLRHRNAVNRQAGSLPSPTIILTLSLFIMLLAFFIILNAISTWRVEKAAPVLQSIEKAFATRITLHGYPRPVPPPSDPAAAETEPAPANDFRPLFDAYLPGYRASVMPQQGILRIEIPMDELEKVVRGDEIARRRLAVPGGFTRGLVALMEGGAGEGGTSMPYRLDIMLQIDGTPGRVRMRDPEKLIGAAARTAVIAAALEDEGAPAHRIGIGLEKGREGRAVLLLQPVGRDEGDGHE